MRRLVVAILSVGAAACGGGSGGGGEIPKRPNQLPNAVVDCNKGSATLTGRYLAPNGQTPVAGAYVYAASGDCWAGTDAQGRFTMNGLPAGGTLVQAEKGFFATQAQAQTGTELSLKIDPATVKLAYVVGSFDSIQDVLRRLGFSPTEIPANALYGDLSQYAAVFLNCGMDEGPAGDDRIVTSLKGYVERGGILYASDFSDIYVQRVFPDEVKFLAPDPRVGKSGVVTTTLVDAGLKTALGKEQAEIDFNLTGWAVVDSVPSSTTVLVRGPAKTFTGDTLPDRPMAVQFSLGKGRVTFTSFHNEAQTTADMNVLLEQMLFGL